MIRFRCHHSLVERVERIARIVRRSAPDLYRIILEDFAAEKEKEFHIGQHLDTSALMAAEEASPYGASSDTERIKRKPAKPVVIYTTKKKPT